ncbi:MAG: phosphatidylglycerophosphatase A [Alphaproteobacteria bacterium]|nr:phosphatidylglycerophosphatase A [Alphaproteobacteria bacterium]
MATWFGIGHLPKAPGTWGSLAALPFAWALSIWGGPLILAAAAVIVFALGVWAAERLERAGGDKDPGHVVIDEVAGQWLTLAAVPADPILYGLGFVLFRVMDITKPWPANWLDRNISGGLGVMLDDIAAGAYAGIALYLIAEYLL